MSLLNAHLVLRVMQCAGLLISTASSGLVKSGSKALNVQSVGLKALGPPCIGRMMTGTQKRTTIWTTDYTRSVAGILRGCLGMESWLSSCGLTEPNRVPQP